MDGVPEEVVQEQVGQLRVLVVGGLDVAQEDRPDDAATAPHQGDAAVVLRENRTYLFEFILTCLLVLHVQRSPTVTVM